MEKQQLVEIGCRLRKRRQELGLTRERMSELADIGSGYYGQLEVGTSQMSIDTLIKLSHSKMCIRDSMWISFFTTIVIRVPLAYLLAYLTRSAENPNGMPESVFISLLCSWIMGAVINAVAFKNGRWRKKAKAGIGTKKED